VLVPSAVVTLALLVALAQGVPERGLALRIWLVAVGVIAARVAVAAAAGLPLTPRRTRFDAVARPDPPPAPRPPAGLRDAEWLLTLAAGTAADVHFRVRPALREVAAQRLAANHGLQLDDPLHRVQVSALCGPVLWEVVRPERPSPVDRTAPGLGAAAGPVLVESLERL